MQLSVNKSSSKQMKLKLVDGSEFAGRAFGALREAQGEVVFNTGMTGYVETLTDPSYRGQILVLTYPLQGNYGVPDGPFESARIQVQGLIVARHTDAFSHHAARRSLGAWLKAHDIPAMEAADTRAITKHLRAEGTVLGRMSYDGVDGLSPAESVAMHSVIDLVSPAEMTSYPGGHLRILVIDTGIKESIIRSLQQRGATVTRVPSRYPWEELLAETDGILLANGPGDPRELQSLADRVRASFVRRIPTLGICLGHQVLALAAGAKTFKLPYGHRSTNQPVMNIITHRCYITSQNHGFAVDENSLDTDWEPWMVNLNDGTNEGIRHRYLPFLSAQFHPEANAGPNDTQFIFDDFVHMIETAASSRRVQQ